MVTLAVGAHPDDIEFGCYGTLAQLAKKEEVRLLLLTSGEVGGNPRVRKLEAKRSAEVIGATLTVLNHRDGYLEVNARTVAEMSKMIGLADAKRVFCPHLDDSHQDHAAAGRIVMACWRNVNRILFYETPTTLNFQPNVYTDISSSFEHKKKALDCFNSQKEKPYLSIDQVRGLAQYRAWQCYRPSRLFEAFVLFRSIGEPF